MTKITHNFYRVKSRLIIGRLLSLFVLLLMGTQMSWGQQSIGTGQFDGGFEAATLNSAALSATTPSTTKWAYDSANLSTSSIVSTGARSGAKAFNLVNTNASTGKYIISPKFNPALVCGDGVSVLGQDYTVQYYVKTAVVGTATKGAIYTNARGSGAGTQGAADTNGWVKVTYRYTGVVATVAATGTWAGFGNNVVTLPFTALVDDFVVYTGVDDVTAPDAPTGPTVTGLNVSWTAPVVGAGNGVDGGGYMVVRYATNPNADNDPNVNGIYAVGNTITNGTGSLAGKVVYVGTATSFTDGVSGSVSGSDYYKIYSVDKAFNYSSEITGTTTAVGTTPQTITFGALSPVTYGGSAFALTATADSSLAVSYASSNTAVATVSGSTVTIVGAGSTNITASQLGDVTYAAATPVIQALTVGAINLTISGAAAQSKAYDGTTAAVITGTLNGIINSDAVTLNGTGTFADANPATGIVVTSTATLGGAKAANYSLTQPTGLTADITKANQTITLASTATVGFGFADYSPATSVSSGTNPITYTSSNPAVATIVANKVHYIGQGVTTITASQAASANYNAATDAIQTLTVGKKRVLYATYNKAMYTTASVYDNDPVVRMLNNENFNVTVVATDANGINLPASFSGYDLLIVQEAVGGGDAVLKPAGKLAIKNLTVPVIYNKVFALQNTRAVTSTTSTGGVTIADTSNLSVTVDSGNQTNSLYSGITFATTSLPLFKSLSDDTGSSIVAGTKAISLAKSLELSATGTLLATVPEVTNANTTVLINDIPAGTQFGTAVTDVCPSRMIAFGFNYGAMCESNGKNITNELLTVWRNAAYILTGQNTPTTLYEKPATTWNGTTWSYEIPDATQEAIIAGTYSTIPTGSFTAKKLTINSGSLTVNSGTNLTVSNEVINNAGANGLVVENNANLIQVNNTTNTGNAVVKRNSNPLYRLDYTIWSSPVLGAQTLADFSPLTSQSPNRFYTYDVVNNQYDNTNVPTAATFAQAAGYLIRMPNTDPTPSYDAGTATLAYPGVFTGVLNNGTIPRAISDSGSGYNMIGNPYSSTISADAFMTANTASIESTLYFWRKTNLAGGSAYATYTPLGGAGTAPSVSGVILTPNGTIQVGQGFFVKAKTGATAVSFTNLMRETTPTSTQFFKTKKVDQLDRVWLNLSNASGAFSQALVGYTANATLGVDAYDGLYFNDSPVALTSTINGGEYSVQGRSAFDATDVVPLNFKTNVAGDYTIAIDHADGVFAAGQSVILTDATTGTETDLTTSAYSFTAAAGTASSRFSLKYQKTLGTNQSVFSDNNVVVYRSKGTLYVNAGDVTIANIKVYDVQGRLVAELKNVKATSATIANLKAANQVLVVKITSKENKVVTKKVVN